MENRWVNISYPFFFKFCVTTVSSSHFNLRSYYSSVPRELILRFYDKFRLDFHLFGYSINEILVKAGYQTIEEEQL